MDPYQNPSGIVEPSPLPRVSQYGSTAPRYSPSQASNASQLAAADTVSSTLLPVVLLVGSLGIVAAVGFLALGSLGSASDGGDDFDSGEDFGGGGSVGGDQEGRMESKGGGTKGDGSPGREGGNVGPNVDYFARRPEGAVENIPSADEDPVKVYVCTVGGSAVMARMYPSDGLCDYIYYTYIALAGDVVVSSTSQKSWTTFQERAKGYRKTGAGVAFDSPYITADLIRKPNAKTLLNGLARNNVPHYGLLNVMAQDQNLVALFGQASTVIKELKNIQGSNQARKTIIAVGMYNYAQMSSWNIYQNVLKRAVQETGADIVIAISSTSMALNRQECFVVPPLAIKMNLPTYPSLERFAPLVAVSYPYNKRAAIVGLSMEMAVLTFHLTADASSPAGSVYSRCKTAAISSADLMCPRERHLTDEHPSSTLAGFAQDNSKQLVFTAETDDTIQKKVDYITKLKLRSRFAWLLYNVHLTDIEGRCLGQPHSRIAKLKSVFH